MNEKQIHINREYKDNVFRILYRDDKERQMELYNAVSGRNYTDAAALQVVTLKHAIYMGMKNDLAFIVSDDLHLYEHQSTINPNMPLRFLHYISKEYEGWIESRRLYGSKPIKLQVPYFTVFYNGTEEYPERHILKLSDLFKGSDFQFGGESKVNIDVNDKDTKAYENKDMEYKKISSLLKYEYPFLELKVLVVNISPGKNAEFLERCFTLREYTKYVERVRKYRNKLGLEEAVNRAVDDCIKEGILADFLRKNKAEVVAMSIFEYDEKEVIDYIRAEEREAGRLEGKAEEARRYGNLIILLTNEGRSELITRIASDDVLREELYKKYQL